jgi:pimeloyl-ACP methyl ester carboxylesterase
VVRCAEPTEPYRYPSDPVDQRGHGRSDQTSRGFTLERFAQDLFTVADDAQSDQFMVVAYSMSGKWAQWMASTVPERVRAQVLRA